MTLSPLLRQEITLDIVVVERSPPVVEEVPQRRWQSRAIAQERFRESQTFFAKIFSAARPAALDGRW